jgi:hypothetical protein
VYVFDLVDVAELVGYVRGLRFEDLRLDAVLPAVNNPDPINYALHRADLTAVEVGKYRSWDAPSTVGSRPGLTRIEGELAPISQSIRLGEYERLRQNALEGAANGGAIAREIFNDARNMAYAVQARVELARGDLLTDGVVTVNENGAQFTVDFGVPAGNLFTTGTAWATVASADPLTDILAGIEQYRTASKGALPGLAVTSRANIGYLLRNANIRALAAASGITPSRLTNTELDAVLASFGVPPIVQYDTEVVVGGSSTRVIPADKFILLPGNQAEAGITLFGVTAEAQELVSAGQLEIDNIAGITTVVEKTTNPVSIWTTGTAIALPVLRDPNKLVVIDTAP